MIAINGINCFGRIGRLILRAFIENGGRVFSFDTCEIVRNLASSTAGVSETEGQLVVRP